MFFNTHDVNRKDSETPKKDQLLIINGGNKYVIGLRCQHAVVARRLNDHLFTQFTWHENTNEHALAIAGILRAKIQERAQCLESFHSFRNCNSSWQKTIRERRQTGKGVHFVLDGKVWSLRLHCLRQAPESCWKTANLNLSKRRIQQFSSTFDREASIAETLFVPAFLFDWFVHFLPVFGHSNSDVLLWKRFLKSGAFSSSG